MVADRLIFTDRLREFPSFYEDVLVPKLCLGFQQMAL